MATKAHPNFERIVAAVKSLLPLARPFSAVCFRCVETSYAHDIVSGEASRRFGGRWNPVDSFRTVYLSVTPETALKEFLARARRMKWPDHRSLPMVMAGIEVKARRTLDLRNRSVTSVLGPLLRLEKAHWRAIQSRRETASQAIGRAASELGLQGLIARSEQVPKGTNLVLFPDRFAPEDRLSAPKLKLVRL